MTNGALKALVRERNHAGALTAHRKPCVTPATLAVAFSHLDRATRLAAGLPEGAPCDHVDLRPYARALEGAAGRSGHADDQLSYAAQARSAVRTLLREAGLLADSGRTPTNALLPEWQPLHEALRGHPNCRHYRTGLREVHDLAVSAGIPLADLTRDVLAAAAEKSGCTGQLASWLSGYRQARRAAGRLDLPDLRAGVHPRTRNVKTLDLEKILATRPLFATPLTFSDGARALLSERQLADFEQLRRLNPLVADSVRQRLEQGARARYSRAWAKRLLGMASRLVAALYATADVHGLDPANVSLFKTFVTRVSVSVPLDSVLQAELGENYAPVDHRSIMRVVMDHWAAPSYRHSPRKLKSAEAAATLVPTYTATVVSDMDYAYYTVDALLRASLSVQAPDLWEQFVQERKNLQAHVKLVREAHPQEPWRDKEQLLEWLSLPQFICLGLPWLRELALGARTEYALAAAGLAPQTAARAKSNYRRALLRYLVAAIGIDGLRISNYTGCRVNVHLFLQTEERTIHGVRSLTITGTRTFFWGDDPDSLACLKKDQGEGGGANERDWDLLPGIVDFELLADWLFDHRVDILVARGDLPCREAYDPANDTFGLFIHEASPDRWARYTESRLATKFGRAVYDMIVSPHVMGRHDVPAWRSGEFRNRCSGLFGGHGGRYFHGSHWVRVEQDMEYAKLVTNDVGPTLKRHYAVRPAVFERRMHTPGIDHPNHFDAVMRAIRARRVIDWCRFDRNCPEAVLASPPPESGRPRRAA
ncbi:hypothetical protein [Roseisolibacter sp. H3M3-2]|uniref:hypothetical protein n=1 Tax=Roseisolibacter sp. H3M3-2 TaxID=3031323 RepID=UPI0023DC3D7B|nr:hypothetical protein [Roseisolibacter sp. H3M3-2]MDF1501317.1 hypothetical protein [Roseisolibacter sp. H3M3-2]